MLYLEKIFFCIFHFFFIFFLIFLIFYFFKSLILFVALQLVSLDTYFPFSLLKLCFIFSYLSFFFKIIINSSWPISMSNNVCDINVSILLSLILFLLLEKKTKQNLHLLFQLVDQHEIIDTPPLAALKTIKARSI